GKGPLYARAGVADYWIVNLAGRVLEVYREPIKPATGRWKYKNVRLLKPGAVVRPLAVPDARIRVDRPAAVTSTWPRPARHPWHVGNRASILGPQGHQAVSTLGAVTSSAWRRTSRAAGGRSASRPLGAPVYVLRFRSDPAVAGIAAPAAHL